MKLTVEPPAPGTLRDWFAGMALSKLAAVEVQGEWVVRMAYEYANLMMEERKKW